MNRLLFLSVLFLFMVMAVSIGNVVIPDIASSAVIKPPGIEQLLDQPAMLPQNGREFILFMDPGVLAAAQYASDPLSWALTIEPLAQETGIRILNNLRPTCSSGHLPEVACTARSGTLCRLAVA